MGGAPIFEPLIRAPHSAQSPTPHPPPGTPPQPPPDPDRPPPVIEPPDPVPVPPVEPPVPPVRDPPAEGPVCSAQTHSDDQRRVALLRRCDGTFDGNIDQPSPSEAYQWV
jgi:hypothetical protein